MLKIPDKIVQISNDFRKLVFENHNNPIFWIVIVILIFIVFKIGYNYLKER